MEKEKLIIAMAFAAVVGVVKSILIRRYEKKHEMRICEAEVTKVHVEKLDSMSDNYKLLNNKYYKL